MKTGKYDVTADGVLPAAATSFDLGMDKIPSGARVVRAWYEVTGANFASDATDAALLSIRIEDSAGAQLVELVAPVIISDAGGPWDVGAVDIANGDVANISAALTADGTVVFRTNGAEALVSNAAVIEVYVEYLVEA
jgi:hypothetical protein